MNRHARPLEFDFRNDFSAFYQPAGVCVLCLLWSGVMPHSPSIVPEDDTYIVLDDFGPLGRAWRETAQAGAGRVTLVRNLLDGLYEDPVRIVAFNTLEGWSRDVTVEIADEVRRRFVEHDDAPASLLRFLDAANRH